MCAAKCIIKEKLKWGAQSLNLADSVRNSRDGVRCLIFFYSSDKTREGVESDERRDCSIRNPISSPADNNNNKQTNERTNEPTNKQVHVRS